MLLISIDPGWRKAGVVAFRNTSLIFARTFDLKLPGVAGQSTAHPIGCSMAVRGFVNELWEKLDASLAEEIRIVVEANTHDMQYTHLMPTAIVSSFIAKVDRRNSLGLPIPRQRFSASLVYPNSVLAWMKTTYSFSQPAKRTAEYKNRRDLKKSWTVDFIDRLYPTRPTGSEATWDPDQADAAMNAHYALETNLPAIELNEV